MNCTALTRSTTPALPALPKALGPALRVGTLALLLGGLWLVADRTGLRATLTQERIQALSSGAGAWGVLVFLAAFAVGQLAQLPGVMFVLAGRVAYGPALGFVVGYLGALLSVSLSFFVVRSVGGRALSHIKWAWVQRALAHLEDRPIAMVALLRVVFAVSPPLNYALSMTHTRFRDYFVGSALGLLAPVAVWVFLSDALLSLLSLFALGAG